MTMPSRPPMTAEIMAQRHGVFQAVPAVLERLAVLIQRQGEVHAPGADEGGEDHGAVEQNDDGGND